MHKYHFLFCAVGLFVLTLLAGCDKVDTNSISGTFKVGPSNTGVPVAYFQGTNNGNSEVTVTVVAVNTQMNQEREYSCTLAPGVSFFIGPNEGWMWQQGEKLFLYYSNGVTRSWTFATNTPSFGRSKWRCTYCRECSDYIRPPGGGSCVTCDHSMAAHK